MRIQPLDSKVPVFQQLAAGEAPVVLVNVFQVSEDDAPALVEAWRRDALWMQRQPGYVSAQLHRGIAGSTVFLNYAVWESVAAFRAAFTHPDFQASLARYPSTAVASPHLFGRLTVDGVCVGP